MGKTCGCSWRCPDVTDARLAERLKDDLLREKAILFQELQHRVANSLQIIASILMQSARRMPSAETRTYLFDAHSLVMSVAALQQQLSASKLEDVELHSYFTELCDSIGASMIPDHEKLKLEVKAEAGLATVDVSVSLGLIVTELVINALKHAFPRGSRRRHRCRLQIARFRLDAVGQRRRRRHAGGALSQPKPASAPASSRPWPNSSAQRSAPPKPILGPAS
jgi:two-component sensor histidine kinase